MGIAVSNIEVGYKKYDGEFCFSPSSTGKVDLRFDIQNTSSKRIKYAIFYLVPYNNVYDVVGSELDGKAEKGVEVTGPLEPNQIHKAYFEMVWYNNTIRSAKLTKVEIQYMDGTEETVQGSEVTSVSYPPKSAIDRFADTTPGLIILCIILPLAAIILIFVLMNLLWSCAS